MKATCEIAKVIRRYLRLAHKAVCDEQAKLKNEEHSSGSLHANGSTGRFAQDQQFWEAICDQLSN